MGSSISPGVADLTMEVFKKMALAKCPSHMKPRFWRRFVDDTYTVLHGLFIDEFTTYLNSLNKDIQFTRELQSEVTDDITFLDSDVVV